MFARLARTPALIIVALAMASCSTLPPTRSPQERAADRVTAGRVSVALYSDPYYYFEHVDVRVDDGVAILTGYVWSPDALIRARQITRRVPGVTRVVTNDLEQELDGRGSGGSHPR
jgi:osmotically-inducible protein OsmY